ncbi:MAG TPA: TonB-dependent receptor [Terriglobia bacterium]|nr:TonB-dependent receptor [Terriglobia bacterium]
MRISDWFSRRFALPAIFVGFLLLMPSTLFGQVDTGAILGTVKDQSGGVIPGAKVTLTNTGTGISITTKTGSDGTFVFRPVKIGVYAVAAEYEGFRKTEQQNVRVDVQQQVVVDLTMLPGQLTQSVEVTGAPPALQTQDASVGQVVGTREVNDLPLNGRNFTFLAQLSAGVTTDQQDSRGLGASGSFAANGERPAQNNYLLDGIDNNAGLVDFLNGTAFVVLPPIDAIQEFKIQTNDYSADVGRSAGAVLNATIKSGTNQIHGDVYEFVRNDIFDAANFFENAGGEKKGEYRLNQFGGSLGGPIRKNKTFFFGDYQGTRIRQAFPWITTVPTNLERSSGYTNLADLIVGEVVPGQSPPTTSDNLGRTFPLGTIFDPATTRYVTANTVDPVTNLTATTSGFVRDPFVAAGGPPIVGTTNFTGACPSVNNCLLNQLPAGRLDSNAISLLNLYPTQDVAGLFSNYANNPVIRNTVNQFDVRGDEYFSDHDTMFARASYSDNPQYLPGPFTGIADGGAFAQGYQTAVSINLALSETHTFSPNTINEARLGFTRIGTSRDQPYASDLSNIPAKYGIQDIPQLPLNGGLPTLEIEGLGQLGSNGFLPSVEVNGTDQLTENLTHIHGKHTFKAGFEAQHVRFTILQPAWGRGYWGFGGGYTDVPNSTAGQTGPAQMLLTPIPSTVPTAPGAADYIGGSDYIDASNFANTDMGRHYYGSYFQDDWKVTPKLTVNLGLRWEYFGQIVEKFGAQSNFLPASASAPAEFLVTQSRCDSTSPSSPFQSTLPMDGIRYVCSSVPGLGHSQNTNFAPRLGFAYRLTPKLVARGGYGIFYGGFENSVVETYVDFPFQYGLTYGIVVPDAPITVNTAPVSPSNIATLDNGFSAIPITPNAVSPSLVSFTGEDFHMKTPYTQGYNLTLQYEMTPNQTVSLGYVGNTVRHLGSYINANEPSVILPTSVANPLPYYPYPDFSLSTTNTSMSSDSYYNSMQLNFERRFSQGLQLLANFTWSQCKTDAVDVLNGTAHSGYRAALLPGFGIQGDYGLCDFQIPHVVHASGLYELPVGKGKRFLNDAHGITNAILGGWRTNWILTLQDGQPWTVGCVIGTTENFGCNALLVPGQNVYAGPHNVNQWINPAAFATPPSATTVGQSDYAPLGGAPSNFLGPGFHRMDASFFKEFPTSERTRLEFRAEIFNITNHPNFSPPGYSGNGVIAAPGSLDYTSPATFGKITSTRDLQNDQREIQFALKFYF